MLNVLYIVSMNRFTYGVKSLCMNFFALTHFVSMKVIKCLLN